MNDMPDLFNFTPEMKSYFVTLPVKTREAIMRGGAKINSLEDLRAAAEECGYNEDARKG